MFSGLMGLEGPRIRIEPKEGVRASLSGASSGRKRLHRRPGYMRGEPWRTQSSPHGRGEEEDDDEGGGACIRNGKSGRHSNVTENQSMPPTCSSWTPPHSPVNFSAVNGAMTNQTELRLSPAPQSADPGAAFSSSFSFIRQSLIGIQTAATETPSQATKTPHTTPSAAKSPAPTQTPPWSIREEPLPGGRFWRECLWGGATLPDCDSRSEDAELTSSLSVDSDSASSVTSGYESATPASDHGWENLLKKYDGVLQDCLHNNRTHTKIEWMMLKLQRLQQKAVLDDDYDAAERFGKKLEELCVERGALRLGLPSTQPSVAQFLQRLLQVVHGALQRTDCTLHRDVPGPDPEAGDSCRRDRLIHEKQMVEVQIAELQQTLAELTDRGRRLDQEIQREEQRVEAEELEASVLKTCTPDQLRDLSRTLRDLVTSENRTQISVAPPASTVRLQEQEQALNLSIKEATAKVVMSQRLGSSLRRKVSETETQLLALHEAKLAAISGNDFSSAKALKAELKAVYVERDRLEALAKRLHSLSAGSSGDLVSMKEQRRQLRHELDHRTRQHENRLKEKHDQVHRTTGGQITQLWVSWSGPDLGGGPGGVSPVLTRPSTEDAELQRCR
uniref:DISC1 scaffold protein n=1 Tax=Sphaeramia orbicularis TaxID=375764 RepID=A0A673CKM0_9TELE